jgi:DNA replication protein DnaC
MDTIGEIVKKSFDSKSLKNSATLSNGNRPGSQQAQTPGSGKPDCPHCGGMGFIVPDVLPDHPSFGRAVACSCRAAEREAERFSQLLQISQLANLRDCTFENFLPDGIILKGAGDKALSPDIQRNLRIAYQCAVEFAHHPVGWLVLKGGYGCGKTHLAAAVGNYQLAMGHPVLFVNVPDLLDHLRATYSPGATMTYDKRFEQVRRAPLLILDDLGTQSNTEWAQEKLYQIFNYRYTAKLPTIITTNLEIEAIEIRIRSRMVDKSLVQIVPITAPDFRHAGGDQNESGLSALSLHRDKTFDNFDLRDRELPRAESENLQRALETAREFADREFADTTAHWLVFNSVGYGNGKTHLAAAIANHVEKKGTPVLFVVVPDLLDHLRAAFNPASGTRYDKRFDEVKTAPLLVLDDLGTESATAWAREKLYQLFNYRYSAHLPTVITMAMPIEEIDPRLATRMLDGTRCTFFVLEAPSYRGGMKGKRAPRKGGGRK